MFSIFCLVLGIFVGKYEKKIREWIGGMLMELEKDEKK